MLRRPGTNGYAGSRNRPMDMIGLYHDQLVVWRSQILSVDLRQISRGSITGRVDQAGERSEPLACGNAILDSNTEQSPVMHDYPSQPCARMRASAAVSAARSAALGGARSSLTAGTSRARALCVAFRFTYLAQACMWRMRTGQRPIHASEAGGFLRGWDCSARCRRASACVAASSAGAACGHAGSWIDLNRSLSVSVRRIASR